MKIRKIIYLVIVTLLLNNIIYSQTSNSDLELMAIRQDMVKPSMTTNYEFFLADFKNYLESKNFKNFEYYTHFQDDYTFRHISPISDLNLLKTSTLSELAKQFNDPEFDLIIDEMNANC
jgi:hypothetical protein